MGNWYSNSEPWPILRRHLAGVTIIWILLLVGTRLFHRQLDWVMGIIFSGYYLVSGIVGALRANKRREEERAKINSTSTP
jgi:hypothetical protein